MEDWGLVLTVFSAIALAITLTFMIFFAFPAERRHRGSVFVAEGDETAFLFDGDVLVDATPSARAILSRSALRGPAYLRLLSTLAPGFPGLETGLASLVATGNLTLTAEPAYGAALTLRAELRGGLTRIVIANSDDATSLAIADPLLQKTMADELDELRQIVSQAPLPIWRERANGDVVWSNRDYLARVMERLPAGEELSWPLPRLFERTASAQGATGQRQCMSSADGSATHWFELTVVAEQGGRMVYAVPIDATVQAELALSEFMQILTQTFAQLPIGLAIFDRRRRLNMFNPALLDLTGLPVDLLARRPTLTNLLDAMREIKMLPEPKDYGRWRRQMNEIESAAASGVYEEMWSLLSGQTYRVVARPHPNGALALMIEDVSTETLRSRRYRADIELSHAITDAMEEAIAVFSQDGRLIMTNPAYLRLWGDDPAAGLAEGKLQRLCAVWQMASEATDLWQRLEDFALRGQGRMPWREVAMLNDGRIINCRFVPLPGGASMIGFRLLHSTIAYGGRVIATGSSADVAG